MNIQEQLMQKNGLVATQLAREWFMLQVGDRIGTVDEYARKFGAGRGTVQAAVRLLTGAGAVRLEARGHLGTYITAIDYELLWQFTGMGAVMGVMPLPYSRLYEGLATGLYLAAGRGRIPFNLAYMRGAHPRLQALLSGRYDFAIMSKLAVETALQEGKAIAAALEFGRFTYVDQHAMLLADGAKRDIEDGMRVGVDRTSIDHYLLTVSQCRGKKVEFVDLAYNQIIVKIQSGEIDAAIWNIDEVVERKIDLSYCPLASDEFQDKDTEAVMVVRAVDSGIKSLLACFIKPEEVVGWQRQVVAGKMVPSY